ncbi:phosphatidylglycerophosphatase B [Actinomycetota bacterium]|nr:phosphatidylglycerophosphatase B [Actinomycetota bacterium]
MSKRILISASILLILFIILAILTTTGQLATMDKTVSAAVHSLETPALTTVLLVITTAGEWFVYVLIILVLLLIPKLRWKVGLPVAITMVVDVALNWGLKQLFAIPRPDTHRLITETGFSFPSGHAMSIAAFIGLIVFLYIRYSDKERRQTAQTTVVLVLAALLILAVGFSRIYLGVHNLSDIMAGYAMGFFLSLLTLGVLDIIE